MKHFSQILFLWLLFIFAQGILSEKLFAQFAGGDGSVGNPYQIATYAQLKLVKNNLTARYRLVADIDASASASENGGLGFEPIGNTSTYFQGSLRGGGHTIQNLTINRITTDYVGLFGALNVSAIVDSIGLLNVTISGQNSVGALAGRNLSNGVSNCYSTGSVNTGISNQTIGGLVGENNGSISDSYSKSAVSGGAHSGGLVANNSGSITNSYFLGSVNGTDYIGGLVGNNSGSITNSYSLGSVNGTDYIGGFVGANGGFGVISQCYSANVVSGDEYIGGLVGDNLGQISGNYSTSSVLGNSPIGGLVGRNIFGTLANNYFTGSVSGAGAGGLVGTNSDATIINSYSVGSVSGNFSGGFVGYFESGTISGSYWNTETSGKANAIGTGSSAGVAGKTTAQMKIQSTFTNWDFGATWKIAVDTAYPALRNVNNAPFAIAGSYITKNIAPVLSEILLNDHDTEKGKTGIIRKILSNTTGTIVNGVLTFPIDIIHGTIGTISYRVGEILPNGDTLWGSTATSTIKFIVFDGGGVAGNPYIINTYNDLKKISSVSLSAIYLLTNNINASASASENSGAGFVPIGNSASPFTGKFSGGNHTISHLTINRNTQDSVGLFAIVGGGGVVDSVGLLNAAIIGKNSVGSVAGVNNGAMTACYSTGSVSGTNIVGGLVGNTIGTITACYSISSVSGGMYVGGLVGNNFSTITASYSSGSVTGTNIYAGGLVGGNSATLINNYSTASVSGTSIVGGLVGWNHDGSITNNYSTGKVSGTSNVGGLLGSGSGGSTTNSFWNTQTSECATSATGTGKTTTQMKTQSTFTGWNFTTMWNIIADSTNPGLRDVNNAPFAFTDSFVSNDTISLSKLLLNDHDVETGKTNLVMKVLSNTLGTITNGVLTFPEGTALNNYTTTTYRVGEILSNGDTLWGNVASSTITYNPFAFAFNGNGTESDPYLIHSYAELKNIPLTSLSAVYSLTNNINASESASENSGAGFAPIGNNASPFTGKLYGNGYTISHLTINRSTQDSVGLFGVVNGAMVDSVGLYNATIIGNNIVGGLIGYNNNGTISGNTFSGDSVKGTNIVGGLIGYNNNGVVSNNSSSGLVNSAKSSGGLIGLNTGNISGSYSTNSVIGGDSTGGFVGKNTGTITDSYSTGSVSGNIYTGGLVGQNYGNISRSYSKSSVSGTSNSGGLVGVSNSGGIVNSYSTGSVSGGNGTGGFVGGNFNTSISNCYATGSITSSGSFVGGFIGYYDNGTITSCFWDTQTSGRETSSGGSGVTGKTTAQMKTQSTFTDAGWDFTTTWKTVGIIYPRLRSNTESYVELPVAGNALRFNSSSVSIPDNAALDVVMYYTIEAWINVSQFTELGGIVSKYQTVAANGYDLRLHGTSPFRGIDFDGMSTVNTILTAGVWYHIAAVNSNGSRTLYINGNEVALTGSPFAVANNSDSVCIGKDFATRFFKGDIEDVRLWNVARTKQEIRVNMHRELAGNESGLVGYWKLNEIGGTQVHDATSNANNGILKGAGSWVESTSPLGSGTSTTHIVGVTGNILFNGIGVAINVTEKNGTDTIVATVVNNIPSGALPSGMNAIALNYWIVNTYGSGTFSADVTFTLPENSVSSGDQSTPANLKLFHRANTSSGAWTELASGSSATSSTATFSGITAGGQFAIGTIGSSALPVELVSFAASAQQNGIELQWKTATEMNNYGFEIEKAVGSSEYRVWSKIGFVEGNGTTNAPKEYSFTDKNLKVGKYSYRLKQIDRDGKFEYSQAVEIMITQMPQVFALEQNYPNPFNPSTVISYQLPANSFTTLKVYDILGKEVATLVNEVKDAGYYDVKFDASKLSSGIYFARLSSSGKSQIRKLLLMK